MVSFRSILMTIASVIGVSSAQYYTCALNHATDPCPPPQWKATYNLTLSTMCQPGRTKANQANYFIPPQDKPWGYVQLDWSVASQIWQHNSSNHNDSTVEATSITNCQLIKNSSNPNTRCLIYHNMAVALQAFESQRKVMYDPTKTNWFLQYTDGQGNKNGTIYNNYNSLAGDQYFWDFREEDVANYYISSVMPSVMHPAVDGTYSDCVKGIPPSSGDCSENDGAIKMNLTQAEIDSIHKATQQTNQRLIDSLIENGKYEWQAFGHQNGIGPGITQSQCTQFMNQNCNWLKQGNNYTLTMEFDANNSMQSLAAFLIVRPEYGWLGYGWESDMSEWNQVFLYDVGEPKENVCTVSSNGIFQREWSYGQVTLDCNKWEATVPHK